MKKHSAWQDEYWNQGDSTAGSPLARPSWNVLLSPRVVQPAPAEAAQSPTPLTTTSSGPILVNNGTYTVQAGDTLNVSDTVLSVHGFTLKDQSPTFTAPSLTNAGTVTVSGPVNVALVGVYNDTGSFTQSLFWNKLGASFTVSAVGQVYGFQTSGLGADFTNDGTFAVSGGPGFTLGILNNDPNFVFHNTGTFTVTSSSGSINGLELDGGGSVDNSGTIAVTGHQQFEYATAVQLHSTFSFTNSGTITASNPQGRGMGVFFTNESHHIVIHNSGTITADDAFGESSFSTPSASSDTLIDNSGIINGNLILQLGETTTVEGPIVHTVANSGTINGNIEFSIFDDIYSGAGGTMNGTITGRGGNDQITGGAGATVVAFSGGRTDYSFVYDKATQTETITDLRTNSPDGADTLSHITQLRFGDVAYARDSNGELSRSFDNGGGTTKVETYDVTGSQPWSLQQRFYDAQHTLTSQVAVQDSGTTWTTTFGSSSTMWTTVEKDAGNNTVTSLTAATDGTYQLTLFDTTNQYFWAQVTVSFDAQGAEHFVSGVADNGTSPVTANDTINALDTAVWFTTPFDVDFGGVAGDATVTGGSGIDYLYGYGGDDTLSGAGANDRLVGGNGNDVLSGGTGDDRFVFSNGDGADTIMDFTAGNGSGDAIDLRGYDAANFTALQPFMSQVGADTVIMFDPANQITLHNVTLTQLNAGDFLFH